MLAELVPGDCSRRCLQEWLDHVAGGDLWTTEVQLIQTSAKRVHGVHFQPLAKTRFITDQASEFCPQGMCQGIGKSGEQHPGIEVGTSQKDGTVQSHDGLARARRTRHSCGSTIVPFYPLALRWMEKDGPFLPGICQRAF